MIKLHKEVHKILKDIEEKGFEAYVSGTCVAETIMGQEPKFFEIATDATKSLVEEILPEAKTINKKALGADLQEGIYLMINLYDDSIEDYLSQQDFTINAMADNPSRSFIDPYGGKIDVAEKLIRGLDNMEEHFTSNPISLLEAVRYSAEFDFDIQRKTYESMVANSHLLDKCSTDDIREVFENILIAEYAGKGLRMLAGTNLMPYIIGDLAENLNRRQIEQFSTLCDNIHKTKKVRLRRLGLFYTALEGKKAEIAVNKLNYDAKTVQHIMDGLYLMEKLHFIRNGIELKDFLVAYGSERYDYIHNLAKAQRIVYDLSEIKIMARNEYMKHIYANKEPIFVEDLKVDGKDLLEAGVDKDKVADILIMLTDMVHRKPTENTKKDLLNYAQKFNKSKFAARTRRVKWLR